MMRKVILLFACSLILGATTSQGTDPVGYAKLIVLTDGVFTEYAAGDTVDMEYADELSLDPLTQTATQTGLYASILLSYTPAAKSMHQSNDAQKLYLVKAMNEAELQHAVDNVMQQARLSLPLMKPQTRVEPGETPIIAIGDKMRIRISVTDSWYVAGLVDPNLGRVATIMYPGTDRR